jgi:hypothetical protein
MCYTAVTPDVAAESLAEWVDKEFDISKTGTFWAPRGPAYVQNGSFDVSITNTK